MKNGEAIAESIYTKPDEWRIEGRDDFLHMPTELSIYVGGGRLCLRQSYESKLPIEFSFFGCLRVWKAYKTWVDWNLERKLKVGESNK